MSKILIIKHGSLGDIISSTSVIYDIKKHFKDYKITLLTTSGYKNFFKNSDLVDEILIDDRKGFFSNFLILKKIISLNFEFLIDLQNSQRTSIYILFIRLFSNTIINATSRFANYRYEYSSKNMPSVINGLSNQVEILGVKTARKVQLNWLDKGTFDFSSLPNKNYFLINPGCSKKNSQKKWNPEDYAKICTFLISKNILPIVIGSILDKESAETIKKKESRVLDLINCSPLDIVFQLSKKAIGAISNDTGPAHLIAASGCKIILVLSNFSSVKTVIPQGKNIFYLQKNKIEDVLVDDVIQKIKEIFKL